MVSNRKAGWVARRHSASARGLASAVGPDDREVTLPRPPKGGGTVPKKQHLPSVSDKEQRMYEHIKESELDAGRSTKRAKAIAAATVVKHHNEEGHSPSK